MVRSQYDCLNRGDIETFMAGIGEDATFIYSSNVSVGGEIKGKGKIVITVDLGYQFGFIYIRCSYPRLSYSL